MILNINIGIIAGKGALPLRIVQNAQKLGYNTNVVVLDGFAIEEDFRDCNKIRLKIGEIKKIIEFLKENNTKEIIFAGKVDRPKWSNLYVDSLGKKLLAKIAVSKLSGDDTVLNIVVRFLEQYGFKVISPLQIWQNQSIVTNSKPSKKDLEDIELGFDLIKTLSPFDVGQSVIVESGHIIGIEGAEGTDNLLIRSMGIKSLPSPSGILVKAFKSGQSHVMDIPTIGSATVQNVIEANLKGIAVPQDKIIILDPDKIMDLANKANIFFYLK